jgi:hypothetical protein
MAICFVSDETGESTELSEAEIIERFNCLCDEAKYLREQNAELKEQLKIANGKAVKVLRRSALSKSGEVIQGLQEEDQPVDHTAMCRACSSQCTEAKALLEQIDRYDGQGQSPVLDGFKMQMARMSGSCEDRKKFQLKNTVADRYGDARGVCTQ